MNIVDVIIILIILFCAFTGAKRGFTKELVHFIGFYIVLILSFVIKNPLSKIMYSYLPFFNFNFIFKGSAAINIIFYEIISFLIVFSILMIILRLLMKLTSIFEHILNATIILGIPSKILGFVVGIIEGFTISFIFLYVISLPIFNVDELNNSTFKKGILKHTPIITIFTRDTVNATNEINDLVVRYKDNKNISDSKFDYDSMNILLKYKIVSVDSLKELKNKDKIKIKNLDKLINKYEEE